MPKDSASQVAINVLQYLERADTIVYDAETSGLDWRINYPVGHVFTFGPSPSESFYVPVRHAGGGNIEGGHAFNSHDIWDRQPIWFEREAAAILKKKPPSFRTIFHHGSFDLNFMELVGLVPAGVYEDTEINQSLLNEFQPSYSLDYCCKIMGVQAKKGETLYEHLAGKFGGEAKRDQMGNFWRLAGDDALAVEYAAGDGTSTWQLREKQQERIDFESLRKVWDVECRCIKVLHRMSWRGVRIDEEQLMRVKRYVERRLDVAMAEFPKDLNIRSSPALQKFFRDKGYTDDQFGRTGKGNPSFTESWLVTDPIGQKIVAARKFGNLLNSFIQPLLERHIYKGRVHTTFNQSRSEDFGTVTGRLSSSQPNMQQVPKRNVELGAIFRLGFIPDIGMIWGSADYSQIEPHLLAYYGRVKVLLDGYFAKPSVDAHTAVAIAAGIDRESGKRLNQALLTGAGIAKITSMLGRPPAEAAEIVDKYFAKMPEIRPLQDRAAKRMRQRGYVVSLLGRRARLDDSRFAYKAVNRLLQCGNADIIKLKMVEIDEYFISEGADESINMLLNIHDSLDYQFTPEGRKHYERALKIMCDFGADQPISLDIPIEVDADEGPNWSIATYGEKAKPYLAEIT